MKIYLQKLLEQFKQAAGVQHIDLSSLLFKAEFADWCFRNKNIGADYRTLLKYMEVNPEIGYKSAEVGKGLLDSIALDSDISMITPYSDKLVKPEDELVVSKFEVRENDIILVPENKPEFILSDGVFNRFITQNPYEQSCLENWENLHNSGNSNITVGVYGCTYDKDYQAKLAALKSFKERLYEGYREEQFTMGDSYFAVVSSDRKVKELVLTKKHEEIEKEPCKQLNLYLYNDDYSRGR